MSQTDKSMQSVESGFIPTGLPGGFFIYDAEGDEEICFADQNVIELFGCTTMAEFREYVGNSFEGMVHPDDLGKIQNDIQAQTFTSDKRHDYVRYRIITKQGETRYIEDFGHLLHGADGKKYFYVYIVDVDQDEYYNRDRNSFAEMSIMDMRRDTDLLTGLMNMPTFYVNVQDLIDGVVPCDCEMAVVHFDIAGFKVFNNKMGFQRGDDLLCRMATTLRREFPDALVARFSNDHFAVCAPFEGVEEHIDQVHNAMTIVLDDARIEVKAGVCKLDDTVAETGTACDRARLACNTVKQRYDKVYALFEEGFYEHLHLKHHIVEHIDKAIENECLTVFYQPVIRVATGKICGYEALARWNDPKLGMLSPGQFIPTLEEYRVIDKLDRFVVEKVCRDISTMVSLGESVEPVSINLSQLDFELCDIFDFVQETCAQYGVPANMLDIEITESALNTNGEHLQQEIKRFRDAGYHIWIDDFGSGYSSLNNLLNYDSDVLKLDLEFLRTYDRNPHAAELIRHIVQGAKDMHVQPLQEGVETAEHLEFLREIGCERAQGYFFAKPMSMKDSHRATRAKGLEWE